MILRYVLHLEWHPGYWPRVSLRRAPRPGDRVINGCEAGTLMRCPLCSGDGFLHIPDTAPQPAAPSPDRSQP